MLYDLIDATIEYIKIGGWVMGPLVVVSMWMWFLIVKKSIDIYSFSAGDRPALECIRTFGTDKFTSADWQCDILGKYLKERTKNDDLNQSILESLRLPHEEHVKQHTGTISLLASVAPLFGLLGTVSGMIKTFNVIAQYGTGNARALASGISEALITTETGLVIAVPGVLLAGFLMRRSNALMERMRRFCLRLSRTPLEEYDNLR